MQSAQNGRDGGAYVRAPGNYDTDEVSDETGYVQPEGKFESLTQQQFAEEADINTIVKRFGLTGQLPDGIGMPGVTGDFSEITGTDFHVMMNTVTQAQEAFMKLPADIRYRFANDPGRVLEFLENPDNRDEAYKLGILEKPAEVPRPAEPEAPAAK